MQPRQVTNKNQLDISSVAKRREVTELKALPKYMQKRAEKYGWNTPDRIAPNVGPLVPGIPVRQSTKKQRSLEFIGWIFILYGIYELGEMMKDFAAGKPTERQEEDLRRYQTARDLLMSTEMKDSEKEEFFYRDYFQDFAPEGQNQQKARARALLARKNKRPQIKKAGP